MYYKHVESWAQTGMLSSKKKKNFITFLPFRYLPPNERKEREVEGDKLRKRNKKDTYSYEFFQISAIMSVTTI